MPQKIWPDFRLHENDGIRVNHPERASDKLPSINRIINLLNMRREFVLQQCHPGRRCCRDNELYVRQAFFQRVHQLHTNVHLTDAYRVQPKRMSVCQRELCATAVDRKSLSEPPQPIAAPPHLQEVERSARAKSNQEQAVVKSSYQNAPVKIPRCLFIVGRFLSTRLTKENKPNDK